MTYKEVSFKNERGLSLSAIVDIPDYRSSCGILFLHGFAGSKDENGLFEKASSLFSQNGYFTFRFDFEGAGQSQGEYVNTSLHSQVKDLHSAIKFFTSTYKIDTLGVIGFSLGATIACMGYCPEIQTMSLWSPALFPQKDMFPRYQTDDIKKELNVKGYINKANLKIGAKIIDDLGKTDLETYIHKIECPVQLIHGNQDQRINYMSTLNGKELFKNAQYIIVPGAGHSYKENYLFREKVANDTLEFFNLYLMAEKQPVLSSAII